ncbi:MAG: 2-octaprenyl-6-methoxyphenyl hydroxylase [Gammaproteobacteria bacterium]|nr:MAG: 2-octaprenyl-6-methoxyphenyl hydroxylase [Gammaproteobacteria bacterium]
MASAEQRFDIVIVGAGAVGACLAIALAELGYTVALIEKSPIINHHQPAFDERHLAFSRSTRLALEGLGLWEQMAAAATQVTHIHVTSRGRFGSVMLDAQEEGLDALGHVLPARVIGEVLYLRIESTSGITVLAPTQITDMFVADDHVYVSVQHKQTETHLHANLLIGADGADSMVRKLFGIDASTWKYDQSAVITNIEVDSLKPGLAFERFVDDGALAMLPRGDNSYAVVCSISDEQADELMGMSEPELIAWLQGIMGDYLSPIRKAGKCSRYPLALVRAGETVRHRLVLIGNAAHFLHPVAAQGFNLSMRDVAALTDVLQQAKANNKDPGDLDILSEYAKWRQQDEKTTIAFTDGLIRLFTNPLLPISMLRQGGMLGLRYIPALRHLFTQVVSGRTGRQPALTRGVSLINNWPGE